MKISKAGSKQKTKIYFKGVPKKSTPEAVILSFLERFGPVQYFKMPYSQRNRSYMGYGHLSFVEDHEAEKKLIQGNTSVWVDGVELEVGILQRKHKKKKGKKRQTPNHQSSNLNGESNHTAPQDPGEWPGPSEDLRKSSNESPRPLPSKSSFEPRDRMPFQLQAFRPTQLQYFQPRRDYAQALDALHNPGNIRFQEAASFPLKQNPSTIEEPDSRRPRIYSKLCT